jgi:hypothetical protein
MTMEPARTAESSRDNSHNQHDCRAAVQQERNFGGHREHLLPSEAEILERFGRPAVEPRRSALVTATRSEIALGDPGCGAV